MQFITPKIGQRAQKVERSWHTGASEMVRRRREEESLGRAVLERAERFKEVLQGMDKDGDGRVSFREFKDAIHSLGVSLPDKEVREIWGNGRDMDDDKPVPCQSAQGTVSESQKKVMERLRNQQKESIRLACNEASRQYRVKPMIPSKSKEQRRRQIIKRKVLQSLEERGTSLSRALKDANIILPEVLDFNTYQSCIQKIGISLGEEDLLHLWNACLELNSLDGSRSGADPAKAEEPVSIDSQIIARALDPSSNLEKSDRKPFKSETRTLNSKAQSMIIDRETQLRKNFLISDLDGSGRIPLDEFQACLQRSGVLLGSMDYNTILSNLDVHTEHSTVNWQRFMERFIKQSESGTTIDQINSSILHPMTLSTSVSGGRISNPSRTLELSSAVGDSQIQRVLNELKLLVGHDAEKRRSTRPISFRSFRAALDRVGLDVNEQVAGHLYERSKVDEQGYLNLDCLESQWSCEDSSKGRHPDNGSEESFPLHSRQKDENLEMLRSIAASRIGNTRKLASMFRRFELDKNEPESISTQDFVQMVISADASFPRHRLFQLAQSLDAGGGRVSFQDFVRELERARRPPSSSCSTTASMQESSTTGEYEAFPDPKNSKQCNRTRSLSKDSSMSSDRSSWIEAVVKNSMKDMHRYEAQRRLKTSRPPPSASDSSSLLILHLKKPP